MNTNRIWANLGVANLERTTNFYTTLGFKSNGNSETLTSFLFGENELVIHFFLKEHLEDGMKGGLVDLNLGNEVMFTLSAANEEEVNQWEKKVEKAGGTLISRAEKFGDNYYGFVFADPDGHRFNVFHM